MDAVKVEYRDENFKFHRGRCRCCLSFGYHRSLTQEYDDCGLKRVFNDVLDSCFRLQIVSGSMACADFLICECCVFKLEDCDRFRRQIDEASKFFSHFKQNNHDDTPKECPVLKAESLNHQIDCSSAVSGTGLSDDEFDHNFFGCDFIDDPDCGWDVVLDQIEQKRKENDTKNEKKQKTGKAHLKGVRKKKPRSTDLKDDSDKVKSEWRLPYKLEEGCLKCTQCGEQFYSKIRLSTHMNLHYPNHICDICGKGFAVIARLKAHLKSHIRSSFPCDSCDKVYNSYNAKESHVKNSHGKMPYRCPHCGIRFINYRKRLKHMSDQHGEQERRYHCTICPSTFGRASHLSTHLQRVHLKEKRLSCETCGAAFYTRSLLNNHKSSHNKSEIISA